MTVRSMIDIPWLNPDTLVFPPPGSALIEPNGLLAVGGDLSCARLIEAYRQGIFPWFEDDQPILWWSPDPRSVIVPTEFKPRRSLAKVLRQNRFTVKLDTAFEEVIDACRLPRHGFPGTWITDEMKDAYVALAGMGVAHSIECYQGTELVGGLYGVSIGRLFFGESMFHRATDASKVAFACLNRLMAEANCPLIDCQMPNGHLTSLGAIEISREDFTQCLRENTDPAMNIDWDGMPSTLPPW